MAKLASPERFTNFEVIYTPISALECLHLNRQVGSSKSTARDRFEKLLAFLFEPRLLNHLADLNSTKGTAYSRCEDLATLIVGGDCRIGDAGKAPGRV